MGPPAVVELIVRVAMPMRNANIIGERANLCPSLTCSTKKKSTLLSCTLRRRRLGNVEQIHADNQDSGDPCLLALLIAAGPAGKVC